MIPKVIHYCWFSKEVKPLLIQRCIKSWEKYMPDYEIKCWDGNSFDFDSIPFVKEAIEKEKWAFAADYVRLYALYTEGGIYLDSDVEVKKSFTPFLEHDLFIGTEVGADEKGNTTINPEPAIFGSKSGHLLMKNCMHYYEQRHFVLPDGKFDLTVCPAVLGSIMESEYHYNHKDIDQQLGDGIHVYPTSIFCNINKPNKKKVYAIHWYANSWIDHSHRRFIFKFCRKYDLMPIYRWIEKVILKLKK